MILCSALLKQRSPLVTDELVREINELAREDVALPQDARNEAPLSRPAARLSATADACASLPPAALLPTGDTGSRESTVAAGEPEPESAQPARGSPNLDLQRQIFD